MAANEPRTTSEAWSNGTTTDASAPDKWFDYGIFKTLFPPLPSSQARVSEAYSRLEQPHPAGYTHVFDTTSPTYTSGSTTTFVWGERDFSFGPRFQSLLRRPGETDEEYRVRQDIAELSCTQGGHTWLKDPASELQVCEHCGGIGL